MSNPWRRTDEIVADEGTLLRDLDCNSWDQFAGMLDVSWHWDDHLRCESTGDARDLVLEISGESGSIEPMVLSFPFSLERFWERVDAREAAYDQLTVVYRLPSADPDCIYASGDVAQSLSVLLGSEKDHFADWVPIDPSEIGTPEVLVRSFAVGDPVRALVGFDGRWAYVFTVDGEDVGVVELGSDQTYTAIVRAIDGLAKP